jgi:hypothetical protein
MDNLKALIDGEYDYYPSMSGINTDGAASLLGALAKLPKEQQGKALRNLMKKKEFPSGMGNSRYEFQQKYDLLPKDIQDGLLNKRLQLCDTQLYVVKDISSKNSIDVFMGTDQKGQGIGNLANQKLDKDFWFCLFAITMRTGTVGGGGGGGATVDFGSIPAAIRNGDFEFEAGNKKLIGGVVSLSVFDTRSRTDIPIGYWKLDNTKLIEPQVEIKMPVKFAGAADANTFMRVELVGTAVVPY